MHLNNAIESFQGAFALFDSKDVLLFCNSACQSLFGAGNPGTLVGCRFRDIVNANVGSGVFANDAAEQEKLRTRWIAYHANPQGTLDLTTTEGRTLRIVHRPTVDGGTVCTALDVTSDVQREKELEHAR